MSAGGVCYTSTTSARVCPQELPNARCYMSISWSPHPRYRLYTSSASYRLPVRSLYSGKHCREDPLGTLESQICRRFGSPAALCVPMARTGLFFGLQEMIRPGQKVVMSPLTIVDVVNMVVLAGGIPTFADIDRKSCAIDPGEAESLIDANTGAVLITHLHGETAGAHVFLEICRRRGVPLIEDASQAFGAAEGSTRLGTIGDLGIYSFGFYKNVNAWRGGMLVSRDPDLIHRIRRRMEELPELEAPYWFGLSLLGLAIEIATWPPLFTTMTHPLLRCSLRMGIRAVDRILDPEARAKRLRSLPERYLSAMSAAQADLVLRQLGAVDTDSAARIANAGAYHSALAGLHPLITPHPHEGLSHIFTYYPIQYSERERLLRYALSRRRDFAAQHLRNCADLPEFREFYRDCPNARAAARELILLPTYPRYPSAEIKRNVAVIQQFFSETRTRDRESIG